MSKAIMKQHRKSRGMSKSLKVYVVTAREDDFEGDYVVGVFTSEDKANEAIFKSLEAILGREVGLVKSRKIDRHRTEYNHPEAGMTYLITETEIDKETI